MQYFASLNIRRVKDIASKWLREVDHSIYLKREQRVNEQEYPALIEDHILQRHR
jgi:cell division protein FtsX